MASGERWMWTLWVLNSDSEVERREAMGIMLSSATSEGGGRVSREGKM